MNLRTAAATTLTALTLVALVTGCTPAPSTSAPSIAPSDRPSSPQPEVTPTGAGGPGTATCATIIPTATVEDFTSLGWTVQSEPFRIAGTEIPGGVHCKWGDQRVTTDRVQVFGWAPIDAAASDEAQKALVASGWRSETAANGVYVTENPDWAISKDADGYGLTYLFGDGWVKLADTRQSLALVDGPQ